MSKKYLIQGYGGEKPFKVIINNKKIDIFNNRTDKKIISLQNFNKVFLGKDGFPGHSMLIKINKKKYIFVGSDIYYFKTDEEINNFTSNLFVSDIAYAYSITDKNAYLFLEKVYFEKDYLNPYRIYYEQKPKIKKLKIKMIQKGFY